MKWSSGLDEVLLSRIEDASLNASAPPQQRWLDGWLVRTSPGKAKRARCINAVAAGRLPLDERLRLATAVFDEAGLPMVMRLTPFSQPPDLDAQLAQRGFAPLEDVRVLVCQTLPTAEPPALPPGTRWTPLGAAAFAEAVGDLRGSPPEQRLAHAERVAGSPVPYSGFAMCRASDGLVLACGQFAREAELVGLYDIFTRENQRGQGFASLICKHLLTLAANEGAKTAYLQVESNNLSAWRVYEALGFVEGYRYWYRHPA